MPLADRVRILGSVEWHRRASSLCAGVPTAELPRWRSSTRRSTRMRRTRRTALAHGAELARSRHRRRDGGGDGRRRRRRDFISAFSMYRYTSLCGAVQRAIRAGGPSSTGRPGQSAVAISSRLEKTPGGRYPNHAEERESRDPNDPGLDRIAREAVSTTFHSLLCWGNLDAGKALIDRHPTRDSSSTTWASQPRTREALPPQPWADLPKVLDLAKRPNV